MSPKDLRERVERAIVARLDHGAWERALRVEQAEVASMEEALGSFHRILDRQIGTSPEKDEGE